MQVCKNLLKNQNCVTCVLSFSSKYKSKVGLYGLLSVWVIPYMHCRFLIIQGRNSILPGSYTDQVLSMFSDIKQAFSLKSL